MRYPLTALTVGLLVLVSLSGVALSGASMEDGSPSASAMLGKTRTDEAQTYVTFKSIEDWQNPPPARAPLLPEPGAPGPYTGPGEQAVPAGWSTWAMNEHNQCGDLRLLFGNQDLNRDFQAEGGIVQAQGSFFIQFQAIGEGAQDITRFSFSFGKSHPEINDNEILNCNEALPDNPLGKGTAGVYIPFYRSDFNSDNGFFIPIETRNVPDGDYAAAVHAYTGEWPNYVEVARAWALAEVVNCAGTGAPLDYCNGEEFDDDENVIANDHTQPWPWVLPGDGQQTHDVDGLTIEVLEPVASINASLNGELLELEEWTPPPRDRDVIPMNDAGSDGANPLEGCPADQSLPPLCTHQVYSYGWKWEGPIDIGDIIQVEVVDRNGNEVFKSLFWDGVGGVIDIDFPEIDFNLLSRPEQTIKAGEELRYEMRVENTGGSEAHADFWLALDGGPREMFIDHEHIQAEWMDMSWDHGHPTHLHMYPGQAETIWVDIFTDAQTPNGTYYIEAALTYPALGEEQTRSFMLEITVDGVVIEEDANATADEEELEESPMLAPVFIITLVIAGAVALRRKRE
jgi:hypothetical protein